MQNDMVVPKWDELPQLTWREKVAYLTHQFLSAEQKECLLTHRFEGDLYIREIHIPADTLLIGGVHRHGHVNQLMKGSLILIHPQGHREAFAAPSQILTLPGYQMVLYSVTDVIARTVHPNQNHEMDVEVLAADIFESPESVKALGAELHRQRLS